MKRDKILEIYIPAVLNSWDDLPNDVKMDDELKHLADAIMKLDAVIEHKEQ